MNEQNLTGSMIYEHREYEGETYYWIILKQTENDLSMWLVNNNSFVIVDTKHVLYSIEQNKLGICK